MLTIENQQLTASFTTLGAELVSLAAKSTGLEYIWQGDPAFWGRHAPVLFPIVGRLKDDQYTYQGQTYQMGQHGFARDRAFAVKEQTQDSITFVLTSDEASKKVYPFDFELLISYRLSGEGLLTTYQVRNTGPAPLYFAIGGHPAFNVPLTEGLTFEDHYLEFSPKDRRIQIPLAGAFIDLDQRTLGQTNSNLDLTRELFENDALIYEAEGLNAYTIRSEQSPHSITLNHERMNYVGIWSPYPKEAPFVCIEPWCGIADDVAASGDLTEKHGINRLQPQEVFTTEYGITVK